MRAVCMYVHVDVCMRACTQVCVYMCASVHVRGHGCIYVGL